MAAGASGALDEVLDRLEQVIGRLADPAAPLERLVTDHEEAVRLVAAAQLQLDVAAERVAGRSGPEAPRV